MSDLTPSTTSQPIPSDEAVIRLLESSSIRVLDSVSAEYEDSFSLETFGQLIENHVRSPKELATSRNTEWKHFIIARVQTWDHKQPDKAFYSYYDAFHLNKILFQTQVYLGKKLIHRLHVLNPLTNTDIIGNVQYFMLQNEPQALKPIQRETIIEIPSNGLDLIKKTGTLTPSEIKSPSKVTSTSPPSSPVKSHSPKLPNFESAGPKKKLGKGGLSLDTRLTTGNSNRDHHHHNNNLPPPSPSVKQAESIHPGEWTLNSPLVSEMKGEDSFGAMGEKIMRKLSLAAQGKKGDIGLIGHGGSHYRTSNLAPQSAPVRGNGVTFGYGIMDKDPSSQFPQNHPSISINSSTPTGGPSGPITLLNRRISFAITVLAKAPTGPLHLTSAKQGDLKTRSPVPSGQITRFGSPVTKEEVGKLVPRTIRTQRRSLSYMNSLNANSSPSGNHVTVTDWMEAVQAENVEKRVRSPLGDEPPMSPEQRIQEALDQDFDNVQIFTKTSIPVSIQEEDESESSLPIKKITTSSTSNLLTVIPSDRLSNSVPHSPLHSHHVHPLPPSSPLKKSFTQDPPSTLSLNVYDAILFATDNDFLESARIRAVFKENAVTQEDSDLFEMAEYTGLEPIQPVIVIVDESPICEWCYPSSTTLSTFSPAWRRFHYLKCYLAAFFVLAIFFGFIWWSVAQNQNSVPTPPSPANPNRGKNLTLENSFPPPSVPLSIPTTTATMVLSAIMSSTT